MTDARLRCAAGLFLCSRRGRKRTCGRSANRNVKNGSHYNQVIFGCNAAFRSHVESMKQSDVFRENAENCLQLAERADGQPTFKRYVRMAKAWMALAEEQDWLDGEVPPLTIKTA